MSEPSKGMRQDGIKFYNMFNYKKRISRRYCIVKAGQDKHQNSRMLQLEEESHVTRGPSPGKPNIKKDIWYS